MWTVMSGQRLKVGQVFVAGGLPTVTYNPRAQLRLESQVEDYLDECHRILSVSGPTKTGKTVLVKNVLKEREAVWISGGAVGSASVLWQTVADELGVNTSIESSRQETDSEGRAVGGDLQLGVAKVSKSGQE